MRVWDELTLSRECICIEKIIPRTELQKTLGLVKEAEKPEMEPEWQLMKQKENQENAYEI